MAKPSTVPRFAENDVVDPLGANNVIEPTEGEKQSGWVPAFMEPSRSIMNWLHRYTYLWCKWANEEGASFLYGTESAKITDTYFSAQANFQVSWTKIGDLVTLNFPEVIANGSGSSANIIIEPTTTWDAAILPVTALGPVKQSFQSGHGSPMVYRRGEIRIQTGASDTWLIYSPADNGDLDFDNFPADATDRGFEHQSISYIAEDPLD